MSDSRETTAPVRPAPAQEPSPRVRVYADMVADLFHMGHVNFLRQARALGDELIVGIHNDADVRSYKRLPVLTMAERMAVVGACRHVDRVVGNAPIAVTPEFLAPLGVSVICHGDDFSAEQMRLYYGAVQQTHRVVQVRYTREISTSDIIARIAGRIGEGENLAG